MILLRSRLFFLFHKVEEAELNGKEPTICIEHVSGQRTNKKKGISNYLSIDKVLHTICVTVSANEEGEEKKKQNKRNCVKSFIHQFATEFR